MMTKSIRQPILMTRAVLAIFLSVLFFVSCGESGESDRAKPVEITILFSSDLLGKIRSCGCTVDDTGGLGRRATYVEMIRANSEHVIVLDAGDAFSIDLSYSQKEADLTWDTFNL
ncbi:MAG: hypothetical protein KAX13_12570, partial [Candidatus Krumholzibacteria bacterium]|nr:hypothetical protein [Candidatus Krumholzibacteria bacterium]